MFLEEKFFQSAILSGIIISFVSYGYAISNASIFGSILFAFGLMSIIFYNLRLFTGDAGFIQNSGDNEDLVLTLVGNIIGCFFGSILLSLTFNVNVADFVENALKAREVGNVMELSRVLIKAIGCGLILTISVKFAREARDNKDIVKILPLLFGVPLFLMCGFFHCIVDVFYIVYGMISTDLIADGIEYCSDNIIGWFFVVVGNLIGCNLPRLIMVDRDF